MELRTLIVITLMLGSIFFSSILHASENDDIDFPSYDNFIVLEAKIGELVYNEMLDGYDYNLDGKNIFIHFEQFTQMLDFPIEFNNANNNLTANGWFIRLENKFNINNQNVTIKDTQYALSKESYFFDEDELYINANTLAKWFPIDISYDEYSGALELTPQEKLPFEEKRIREKKRLAWQQRDIKSNFPIFKDKIRFFNQVPMADISLSSNLNDEGISTNYNALIATDIFPLNWKMNISGDSNELDNLLINGSRNFNNKYITKLDLGDINVTSTNLVSVDNKGFGVSISNFKNNKSQNFDKINLSGQATEGWEVEVYNNNELQDFKIVDSSNQYNFNDIAINFGKNEIREVLYGPQGEIIERRQDYYVDSSLIPINEFLYSAQIYNANECLITCNFNNKEENFNPILKFDSMYGLGRNITTKQGIISNSESLIINGGASISYGQIVANLEGYADFIKGNSELKVTALSRFNNMSVRLSQHLFNDKTNRISETQFNLNSSLKLFNSNVSTSLFVDLDINKDSSWNLELTNRLSSQIFGIYTNNQLNFRLNDTTDPNLNGTLSMRERLNNDTIKLDLNYTILPELSLDNMSVLWQHNFASNFNSRLNASYSPASNDYNLGLGFNYKNDGFTAGIQTNYNANNEYSMMFNLSFSLYQNPINNELNITSEPVTQSGLIAALGFLDSNYNGIYDQGEETVEDLAFNRGGSSYKTDASNAAFILPSGTSENIGIVEETSPDPMTISSQAGYNVTARAGTVTQIMFPLVESSEIEGQIETQEGKAIGGITLYLTDSEGKRVKEFISEYDGYFLIDRILPGKYFITVSSEDLERINHRIEKNISIEVLAGSNIYDGNYITLIPNLKY